MKIIFPAVRIAKFLAVSTILLTSLSANGARPVSQAGWIAMKVGLKGKDLNTVYFLDSKRGWIGGDNGYLSRTEDGGQSWMPQAVGTKEGINDIYFRDKEAGFLLAGNTIFVTRDDGSRWEVSRSFLPTEFEGAQVELYSVRFSSKKKGWVVGSVSRGDLVVDSILVYTDDAGGTWRRQRTPSSTELIHIDFVNDKRGWIVGAGGTILRSEDQGRTWIQQDSTTKQNLYALNFNKKIGWAVGGDGIVLRFER